jgi:hypothetical protein
MGSNSRDVEGSTMFLEGVVNEASIYCTYLSMVI